MSAVDLLADPVTHAQLAPASADLVVHLQGLAAKRALRHESAALVHGPFEGAWVATDRKRVWLIRQGVADFMPGAAVLLHPDDPA